MIYTERERKREMSKNMGSQVNKYIWDTMAQKSHRGQNQSGVHTL